MKKIIVAALALALMTGYAYAADWNFYGSAKVYTVWYDADEIDGPSGDTQFAEGLYAASKIGATVKVSDELTGGFEYGACDGKADVRLLYGEWNFGSGTLTVGKAYTPINITYSNQFAAGEDEDLGLGGYGDFDQSRTPEVKLTFGGFSIAILDPDVTYDGTLTTYETQAVIPTIAVGYTAAFNMGEVVIGGAYNTFEVNDKEDIDAFGIGLGGKLNFGAFGLFGTFVWGENIGNLGTATSTDYAGYAYYDGTAGKVYDCESIGGTIGATFTVNEMFSLEAGYGYIYDEYDDSDESSIAQSYYLQAIITLAPGVTVTPEIGVIDGRETGNTEATYFGAGWEIAF